jgi:FKBP-type peptidyl-prolyl cis-trans isomerase
MSYVIGRDVGSQFKDLEVDIRIEPFVLGIEHVRSGGASLIDTVAADSLRRLFAIAARERLEQRQQELAEEQRKESVEFLARNRQKPGIKTTTSGLQYKVLEQGRGPRPEREDSVLVEYTGMLVDGTVFDSAGAPVVLELQRTIPGLTEGIMMMRVGSRYRFYLPPDLAFGEEGIPPMIPPNAVLIFDVQLVNIGGQQKASLR